MKKGAIVVGSLYLLLIPIFASIYAYAIPQQFYHGSILKEHAFLELEKNIKSYIEKNVLLILQEENNGILSSNAAQFEVEIKRFSIEGNSISIRMYVNYDTGDEGFSLIGDECILGPLKDEYNNAHYWGASHSIDCFRPSSGTWNIPDEHKYLVVPEKFEIREKNRGEKDKAFKSDLRNYVLSHEGKLTLDGNSFSRMLYFSAVTITTLGYGDIVPISDLARGLVGLESVLGIVLIGLFLYQSTK